jgi:N-succinyldiaminopimelate aminotransferase
MAYPERFSNLPEYAFPRLRKLLDTHAPGGEPIAMTIGEPRHPMPDFVGPILAANLAGFAVYPPNDGAPDLLAAISGWIARRYGVTLPEDRLMVLNGTREGLFNAAIALCPETKNGKKPVILMPNPFYQVYAVAALTVGAEPVYVPATAATGHLPDYGSLPQDVLDRVALAYICSPANPQGAVASKDYLADLLALAEKHDFKVLADECYSEIWRDAPPPGLCRSPPPKGPTPNAPSCSIPCRNGRTCPASARASSPPDRNPCCACASFAPSRVPPCRLPLQMVAKACWEDEDHVTASRAMYQAKFAAADRIFAGVQGYQPPGGGFFLWMPVDDGEAATLKLWTKTGVRVLPGSYLSREVGGDNPGKGYIRVALVAPAEETQRGLTQLRDCLYG